MSTVVVTHVTTPPPLRQPEQWPARITIHDLDGQVLSEAEILPDGTDDRLLLTEVTAPDRLLSYYFGKSCRQLLLNLGDRALEGWLGTRWDANGRIWWVELDPA